MPFITAPFFHVHRQKEWEIFLYMHRNCIDIFYNSKISNIGKKAHLDNFKLLFCALTVAFMPAHIESFRERLQDLCKMVHQIQTEFII